jgi:LCP family protein required for cell wall assembly
MLLAGFVGQRQISAQDAVATPSPDEIPAAAPMVVTGDYDISNVLLLGSDTSNPHNSGRTDVIVIISINFTEGTAALLSIPRDLYVYIPGHGMGRINTAYALGETAQDGSGRGPALIEHTLTYNLGLHIDHYARVDFNGFREIVDSLGGIQIAVDCGIQDWRLRAPELDPQDEANWELYTLPIGVHQLDGDTALWYARSRRTSSDFDRGRRHQVLLRALLRRIQAIGLLEQVRDVWPQVLEVVQTDISVDSVVRMISVAAQLRPDRVASYTFEPSVDVRAWRAPDGAAVQAPVREQVQQVLARFLTPPSRLQVRVERPRIEVLNASGNRDLAVVAADRLAWEGFDVSIGDTAPAYQYATTLVDYTGQSKGSSLRVIQAVLRIADGNVVIAPAANRSTDFRVTLGGAYYACTYDVLPVPVAETDTPG